MTDKKDVHEDEGMDIIHLDLEDGTELECGIIGIFEAGDKEYMALLSVEDEEVLLFEYVEHDDEFELMQIEDDEEFDLVCETYYDLIEEEDEED